MHVQNNKKRGIDEGVKEMIRELYNFGVTGPMNIIYALRDKKVDKEKIPSRRQIYNFLYELKQELFGPATITYSELKNWCQNNLSNNLTNENDPYVVDYYVSIPGKLIDITLPVNFTYNFVQLDQYFRLVMSTNATFYLIHYCT